MKPQSTAKSAGSSVYSITPPSNFSYAEENICRCCYPVSRANISFVQSISVNYVVNLSARKLDSSFQTFCEEKGVEVNNVLQEGEAPPFNPLAALESWITTVATTVVEKSLSGVVMIIGSPDSYFDCLVLACIRRAQEWSYVSILAEFRHFTWPHKLFDFEQVIEAFNVDGLRKATSVHEFFAIHENFKEEEEKLLLRCKESDSGDQTAVEPASIPPPPSPQALETEPSVLSALTDDGGSEAPTPPPAEAPVPLSEAEEQRRIDLILKKLFFSPKNHILSEGVIYDATLSLINDKDEED